MAYPATPLVRVVEVAFGADLTADPASWTWTDVSAYLIVRKGSPIKISRGRASESSTVGASRCELRLANVDSRFTLFHPLGAYYPDWRRGTPIRVRVNPGSGLVTRFTGFVEEVYPGWPTGRDDWSEVQVVAQGVLRRLGQGRALDSPLRRMLLRDPLGLPVAYWPMEDGSDALSLGSATGGPLMSIFDMRPGGDSTIVGSAPLPTMGTGAYFSAPVPTYPATGEWAVRWTMRLPAAPSVKTGLMAWSTDGTVKKWVLSLVPSGGVDQLVLEGFDASGTEIMGALTFPFSPDPFGGPPELYGEQLYFQVDARRLGADIEFRVQVKAPSGQTTTYTGSTVGSTFSNIINVFHSAYPGLTAGGYTVGHCAVAADRDYAAWSDLRAVIGFSGESASDRFDRLCAEERIGHVTDTGPAQDSLLGPQQRASVLQLLRLAEDAESGLLWEMVDGQLAIRTRDQRYNRTPTLALDCARHHVKLPFAPAGDDQRLVNEMTISRVGGATATDSDVDVRDGTYAGSAQLNLYSDADVPYHTQWRVHLGRAEELRIPSLSINLQSTPDLIDAWLATDIGDWLTVDNLPVQYPPGQAGCVLEGYTETFDAVSWSADLGVSPSRPWEVFEIGHDRLGRLDTAGSQLAAGVSATATTLSVTTTTGSRWITSAEKPAVFPLDIEISGIRLRVTAITGTGSTQTFTVTRSVDGFDKALPTGSPVKLWRPGVLAL